MSEVKKEKCETCRCDLNYYGDCANIACPDFILDDENPNENEGAK